MNPTYDITIHTDEEIEQVKETMPKLGPLVGVMKVDQVSNESARGYDNQRWCDKKERSSHGHFL